MKSRYFLLFTFVFLLARVAHAEERILSFHSDVTVHEDASMDVKETITVQSEGEQIKHGIYRDFPTEYKDKYGLRKTTEFNLGEVLRDGDPDGHHSEYLSNGIRVYIGEKDVELTPGVYTYTITYKTDRQLGFFDNFDELYWNVTGNGWQFPIDKVTATIALPRGISRDRLKLEGYTGPKGSKDQDFTSSIDAQGRPVFETTKPLLAAEGLTIVVDWPKGFVKAPTVQEKRLSLLRENLSLVVGFCGLLGILVFYIAVWTAFGRDPTKGTIIPLYEAPDGLSPAAVRYIRKMSYDDKAFAANLIDMAVKKHIRIEEKNHYTLWKLEGATQPLTPDEQKVLNELLGTAKKFEITQSQHSTISGAIDVLKKALKAAYEKNYFINNSRYFVTGMGLTLVMILLTVILLPGTAKVGAIFMSIWLSGWSVGVFVLLKQVKARWTEFFYDRGFLNRSGDLFGAIFITAFATPFIGGEIFGIYCFVNMASPWVGGVVLMAVSLNILFHHLLKAPTLAGRKVLDKIEGLRMYLATAEKDRLNAMTSPKKTPEIFEKFLPYALALDVEQQWSEQFAEVLSASKSGTDGTYSPSWYSTAGAFAVAGFASSIGNSLSGSISSSSVAPGSSSGGGGGGSSGGGGGGGGGGGW